MTSLLVNNWYVIVSTTSRYYKVNLCKYSVYGVLSLFSHHDMHYPVVVNFADHDLESAHGVALKTIPWNTGNNSLKRLILLTA